MWALSSISHAIELNDPLQSMSRKSIMRSETIRDLNYQQVKPQHGRPPAQTYLLNPLYRYTLWLFNIAMENHHV